MFDEDHWYIIEEEQEVKIYDGNFNTSQQG